MEQSILELSDADIYQGNHLVLKDINISLKRGDFVYLIGSTGSGKSSLLKTLYADIPLLKGKGQIVNYDLRKIEDKEIPYLRRKLGVVFQDFQLLMDRTVFDNLNFVLQATGQLETKENSKKIQNVLSRVGMATKEHKMPYQLSGGEQQRIAIARSLLNNPPLILADEPTGNLDPHTSEEIMHLLEEISSSGQTILMATHDYALLLKFPHATWKCSNGSIATTVQKTL
ncbi:MAG: phosphonate ABC transporter ATP-binding protein [Cryomorphaceae bacterium]|nr:phosphonate ABC transporter ATP-binding protein [Cryomorphaceae bacterium]|tara:strand:+ start:786 stop:1469 length:684 start_codon:yes stop_codon:yes gene_type:complete